MKYPTIEEVNAADHEQICRWHRFLPSPGTEAINADDPDMRNIMEREAKTMDRIAVRLQEFGGFTAAISKRIGLEP